MEARKRRRPALQQRDESASDDTPSFSAALVKLSASATATKARSWPKSVVEGRGSIVLMGRLVSPAYKGCKRRTINRGAPASYSAPHVKRYRSYS